MSSPPDPGAPGEAYLCYGFGIDSIQDGFVRGLMWNAPKSGGVTWHHATLYAVPTDFADGPCDGMPPGAVGLHVWAPGGDNLVLPDGVGIHLPPQTKRMVVEMHVLRTNSTAAESGSIGVCLDHEPVTHPAMFFAAVAPVPAIRPHMVETSRSRCVFHDDAHLWSIWPHMHQVGTEIEANLVRANGETTMLSHVVPWISITSKPTRWMSTFTRAMPSKRNARGTTRAINTCFRDPRRPTKCAIRDSLVGRRHLCLATFRLESLASRRKVLSSARGRARVPPSPNPSKSGRAASSMIACNPSATARPRVCVLGINKSQGSESSTTTTPMAQVARIAELAKIVRLAHP